jgi:hypothetical protein
MRAKLLHFKWQPRWCTRARVLGQVWDGGNERGDGTRLGERHQRLFLETLRHDNRQTRDSCPRRRARASMGLRRSRSSSSALITRDMNGDRMEASRAGEGEERGGEDEVAAAAAPPPSAGTPAFGEASLSNSILQSLASPKARPMLLSSSTVNSTATLSVIFSFLPTASAHSS